MISIPTWRLRMDPFHLIIMSCRWVSQGYQRTRFDDMIFLHPSSLLLVSRRNATKLRGIRSSVFVGYAHWGTRFRTSTRADVGTSIRCHRGIFYVGPRTQTYLPIFSFCWLFSSLVAHTKQNNAISRYWLKAIHSEQSPLLALFETLVLEYH